MKGKFVATLCLLLVNAAVAEGEEKKKPAETVGNAPPEPATANQNEKGGDEEGEKQEEEVDPSAIIPYVVELTNETFDALVGQSRPAFIEFYSPTCGYCKQVAPAITELARKVEKRNRAHVRKHFGDDAVVKEKTLSLNTPEEQAAFLSKEYESLLFIAKVNALNPPEIEEQQKKDADTKKGDDADPLKKKLAEEPRSYYRPYRFLQDVQTVDRIRPGYPSFYFFPAGLGSIPHSVARFTARPDDRTMKGMLEMINQQLDKNRLGTTRWFEISQAAHQLFADVTGGGTGADTAELLHQRKQSLFDELEAAAKNVLGGKARTMFSDVYDIVDQLMGSSSAGTDAATATDTTEKKIKLEKTKTEEAEDEEEKKCDDEDKLDIAAALRAEFESLAAVLNNLETRAEMEKDALKQKKARYEALQAFLTRPVKQKI